VIWPVGVREIDRLRVRSVSLSWPPDRTLLTRLLLLRLLDFRLLNRRFLREAGYRTAVSVHQGKADLSGNPYCLRRLFIRGDDTAWDFHLNLTRGRARL
jgi:hypothetical protein